MNEKQFDWLDDRFREAADQHEPPFDEASWQKLESRLDNSRPKRRAGWWWFTDALILGMLLFIAYQLVNSSKDDATSANNTTQHVVARTATEEKESAATSSVTDLADESQAKTSATTQDISEDLSSTQDAVGYTTPKTYRLNTKGQSSVSSRNYLRTDDGLSITKAVSQSDGNATVMPAGGQDGTKNDNPLPQSKIVSAEDKSSQPGGNIAGEAAQQASTETSVAVKEEPAKKEEMAVEKETPPAVVDKTTLDKSSKEKGFYIYAMGGPEWSMVPGNEAGGATFAWGLGLGYRISPKWAVQGGYFKSRKMYEAGPGDYKPKPGTYYYNLTIKHVEADCHITEIPIALSYTLLDTRKQNLFATVGLSSYIMKSEEYHYDYIRANSTPGYAKYHYSTNNSHLFAGLLISGGYSVRLFDGFSLSAEPYVKVPLYGVGEGSIKIYSFGMMAGARYNLPSFRRK